MTNYLSLTRYRLYANILMVSLLINVFVKLSFVKLFTILVEKNLFRLLELIKQQLLKSN